MATIKLVQVRDHTDTWQQKTRSGEGSNRHVATIKLVQGEGTPHRHVATIKLVQGGEIKHRHMNTPTETLTHAHTRAWSFNE